MKKISDKLFYLILALMGIYLLYTKGLILTNFESVTPKIAYQMIKHDNNLTLLDVRTIKEFKEEGKIAQAKLIPIQVLANNLTMLDRSKKILVYCRSGNRSVKASRLLSNNGFTVINMQGGINRWKEEKLPLQ